MSEVKISNVAMAAAESWFHGTSVPRLLVDEVAERFQSAIDSATAELRRVLEELKRTQVVCPNCQTSKHLQQASAGWWCNGCGGGITQKELEIQSLEQRLKDQRIVQESNRILLEKQAAENDELKRQLWGAERRVVNLEQERDQARSQSKRLVGIVQRFAEELPACDWKFVLSVDEPSTSERNE